jgi:hypothetical protein
LVASLDEAKALRVNGFWHLIEAPDGFHIYGADQWQYIERPWF